MFKRFLSHTHAHTHTGNQAHTQAKGVATPKKIVGDQSDLS